MLTEVGPVLTKSHSRELCKERKVLKLDRHGRPYTLHVSNVGVRGGGAAAKKVRLPESLLHKGPRARMLILSQPMIPTHTPAKTRRPAGSPLKTMQLALPELDAAARSSPVNGKEVTLKTPKEAVFKPTDITHPSSTPKASFPQKPEQKDQQSLEEIIAEYRAKPQYGSRTARGPSQPPTKNIYYPTASTNYVMKQHTPPAELWAKNEAARSRRGVDAKAQGGGASKIEEGWCEVGEEDGEEDVTKEGKGKAKVEGSEGKAKVVEDVKAGGVSSGKEGAKGARKRKT